MKNHTTYSPRPCLLVLNETEQQPQQVSATPIEQLVQVDPR